MPPTPKRHLYHTSTTDLSHAIDRSIDESIFPVAYTEEEENFFLSNPKPSYLSYLIEDVKQFLSHQRSMKRDKVVLVTSGGTTVPLENNTVRFVDNFSAGTRGACSAEYFLKHGYSVIFLHREFSLVPFDRLFQHNNLDNNNFLDFFDSEGNLNTEYKKTVLKNKRLYEQYLKVEQTLLMLPFTTVNQYLWSLKSISQLMDQRSSLFYLAAAVSDFYIPYSRLPKHKIQSRDYKLKTEDDAANGNGAAQQQSTTTTEDGRLIVSMDPVPKFLRRLVESWAPNAMLVSFKLETDPSILLQKAQLSLEKYQHQLVIGNLLQTRKREVLFVAPELQEGQWIKLDSDYADLEEVIVKEVSKHHDKWIKSGKV
ncbi:phosphopantothenate--cysteine ligase CAB2 KNAG_0A05310 [Huiozyma naganishii CBS 8797]|uniref:Uncharacterized protein n=1 Tax=Huiozyma naganishii (strain ATCC MYA-139 / BCRC 22969 / CBS 8797 / KCTC 17520 / NBRC 10181 / NCYC 3082 / Yp74L-3) TaxID=1071383 RepID=J7RTU8_HUIN7|nr:hypothetical protein KNAG_0A05310 [Kazachstania naganishii CBS 8797]CCK68197.1 hypothetical protein KNAG_0A05310 [Kazachstania naganishii CBS 8797]